MDVTLVSGNFVIKTSSNGAVLHLLVDQHGLLVGTSKPKETRAERLWTKRFLVLWCQTNKQLAELGTFLRAEAHNILNHLFLMCCVSCLMLDLFCPGFVQFILVTLSMKHAHKRKKTCLVDAVRIMVIASSSLVSLTVSSAVTECDWIFIKHAFTN